LLPQERKTERYERQVVVSIVFPLLASRRVETMDHRQQSICLALLKNLPAGKFLKINLPS
jgi:hypothetical protein